MTLCEHCNLVLLPEQKSRLRCRHCHLTIKPDELENGFCPECFAANRKKNYDFETIDAKSKASVIYRCEECGAIIEC